MSLDAIFNPRSIAVVGATEGFVASTSAPGAPAASFNAHTQIFLYTLIDWGYPGRLYPVNTKGDEIRGLKVYRSVRDIPGPVDYVICIIPADATPGLVQDCAAKGVKGLHLYTAGFAETGLADKGALQADLVRMARGGGVRLIGPNCMGIYRPKMGMTYGPNFPRDAGNVAFISQSGSYTLLLVRAAAARGVRFSKVVSYGNASDLDEIDLLDYLADDPETEIIGAYLEGAKDGPGLARALAKAASRKPTIIIKKGSTEAGKRGASTHTGALAGDDSVWDSMLKQTGAIRVEDFEEMADLMTTFAFFPLPQGRRAVLFGVGGGAGVRASDECEAGGLVLPLIPEKLRAELARSLTTAGTMLRNPVDPGHYARDFTDMMQRLDSWEEADMMLWQIAPDIEALQAESILQYIGLMRLHTLETFRGLSKPRAVIVHGVESDIGLQALIDTRRACAERGVAFYPSIYRAARAIGRYMDYCQRHGRKPSGC
jgi:acyl-CoA synthetase (NDP forming)